MAKSPEFTFSIGERYSQGITWGEGKLKVGAKRVTFTWACEDTFSVSRAKLAGWIKEAMAGRIALIEANDSHYFLTLRKGHLWVFQEVWQLSSSEPEFYLKPAEFQAALG